MELNGLRTARLRRVLTQSELASLVGMTPASISRIETGATKARISTVRKIAIALDVDPTELLGFAESPHTRQQKGLER
ncbi:MAG: helix-turn-helix domain-containing protein [Thermomicrobiales bacterium]